AVELRLCEICRRLAENLVGPTQITVFALELLEPLTLLGSSDPAAAPHPSGAAESSRAASRPNSRSSVRPTGSPPIPIHTRARARRPAEPPAPAPPPSTALLLPWLQFLKGGSLRQTRGDSGNIWSSFGGQLSPK